MIFLILLILVIVFWAPILAFLLGALKVIGVVILLILQALQGVI